MCVGSLTARWWYVGELLASLRVQTAIGLVVGLLLFSLNPRGTRKEWSILLVLVVAHAWWLSPAWLPLRTTRQFSTNRLDRKTGQVSEFTVLSMNVLSSNQDHAAILTEIQRTNADLVAIQELSQPLTRRLERELGGEYPYQVLKPDEFGNFGIGLISKFPIQDHQVVRIPNDGPMTVFSQLHFGSQVVRLVVTHPVPPMNTAYFEMRNSQLDQLAAYCRDELSTAPKKNILMIGDMNLTPWSPHFGRLLRQSGLISSADGHGIQPTWYAAGSAVFPLGLVIDQALVSPRLLLLERRIGLDIGSDHRPLFLRYRLPIEP